MKNRLFTEAEIYEAVCISAGDDGFRAQETLSIINSDRSEYGILSNETYAKERKDFAKTMSELHKDWQTGIPKHEENEWWQIIK